MLQKINTFLKKTLGFGISRIPRDQYGYFGDYKKELYDSLLDETRGGYNFPATLQKLKQDNKERKDTDIVISFPLLASVLYAKPEMIVDLGGAFGASYRSIKRFLPQSTSWTVVEQKVFVEEGKAFADERLSFNTELVQGDFLLVSTALQYLKDPFAKLQEASNKGFRHILLDRTTMVEGPTRLTQQKVNPKSYDAHYPVWFFNESELIAALPSYRLLYRYDVHPVTLKGASARLGGVFFERV